MSQQDQTLDYFHTHAREWQGKAEKLRYSVIHNRHRAVMQTMRKIGEGALLDVGCGAGQLAIEAATAGWQATGVDFAEDMIEIARANNERSNTAVNFVCASIFDFEAPAQSFDVISAQGFIEYISLEQLDQFLRTARKLVRDRGAIAIGSRNRLFNLVSLNAFTELEVALGTVDAMVKEAVILQTSTSQEEAISGLRDLEAVYPHPREHPLTGVKVDTRYQFAPADLLHRIERWGFEVSAIYPVHYHAMPVQMMTEPQVKALHDDIALHTAERFINRNNLIPYASSYVMEARPDGA